MANEDGKDIARDCAKDFTSDNYIDSFLGNFLDKDSGKSVDLPKNAIRLNQGPEYLKVPVLS